MMSVKKYRWLLRSIVVSILCHGYITHADDSALSDDLTAVINMAWDYTGFQAAPAATLNVRESGAITESQHDSMPPMLGGDTLYDDIWVVTFDKVVIANSERCKSPWEGKIWMDAGSGFFLGARLVHPDRGGDTLELRSPNDYQLDLASAKFDVVGLPADPPKQQLLDVLLQYAMFNRCDGCQTIAWYVMLSERGEPPEPYWVLLDCCLPFKPIGIGKPGDTDGLPTETDYLNVYHAETGRLTLIVTAR